MFGMGPTKIVGFSPATVNKAKRNPTTPDATLQTHPA